jgi:hypothetical protein
MLERWEAVQNLQQVGRAELRRSTGSRDLLGQGQELEFSAIHKINES